MFIHYHSLVAGLIVFPLVLLLLQAPILWGVVGVVTCLMIDSQYRGSEPLKYHATTLAQACGLWIIFGVLRAVPWRSVFIKFAEPFIG